MTADEEDTMQRLASCAALAAGTWFAIAALTPSPAVACGGTFCDAGPQSMPVSQSGENILFVQDGAFFEAHIEIQYDPETNAENFAWVIPVSSLPEISVGSDLLFSALLARSVPTYGSNTTQQCPIDAGGGDDGDGGVFFDSGSDPNPPPGVEVVLTEEVGAFQVAVLQATNVADLMTWLGENGYQQDPNAEPIFQEYLDEGFLFVALKLSRTAEMAEIHPVVLRYEGDEPCVPIRLTRIAAVPEMEIRTFFLGDHRSVPSTYKHVLVNPLKLWWNNFASNYTDVISLAVDADGANGRAFVTEFAGAHDLPAATVWRAEWDGELLAAATDVFDGMSVLVEQGLVACAEDWETGANACDPAHPLRGGLLQRYLPPPAGVEGRLYWGCLSCYADQIDLAVWDAAAFGADLDARIVTPAEHARDVLLAEPYLTRLYTRISPWEMTKDPMFYENPDLPDVAQTQIAQQMVLCNGDSVYTLPDGREVYVPAGTGWPDFPAAMPWEETVEQPLTSGPSQVLVTRTAEIDALLAEWNASHGWPPGGDGSGGGDGSATDDDDDEDPSGGGGGGGGGAADDPAAGACACDIEDGRSSPMTAGFAMLALGALFRRRRR
jgi:hypothetical protein